MRSVLLIVYILAAIAGIVYFAVPIGGHVSGGVLTSMGGGWAYLAPFCLVAAIVLLVLKPGNSFGGAAMSFVLAGLAAAAVAFLLKPAPPGHLALTVALGGLAVLSALFALGVFGRKA